MKKILCLFFLLLFVFSQAYAAKWQTLGTRAAGMGGAGVAVAAGTDAQYWNPANLAFTSDKHNNEIALSLNAEIEATGKTLSIIDELMKMSDKYEDLSYKIDNNLKASAEDIATIFEGFALISELLKYKTGALIDLNASVSSKFKKLAFSFRTFGTSGVTPFVDSVNIGLGSSSGGIPLDNYTTPSGYEQYANLIASAIDTAGIESSLKNIFGLSSGVTSSQIASALINMALEVGASEDQISKMTDIVVTELPQASDIINAAGTITKSYDNNETQILIDAGLFAECAVGYGTEVFRGISVGTNLKIIQGQMAQTSIMILKEDEKIGDAIDEALKNKKTTTSFAADIGANFDFSKFFEKKILFNPKFGLIAKNINSPSFERPSKPQNAPAELIWRDNSYSLDRQIRAGIALNPVNNLIFACDIDVFSNKTMVDGFYSQELALGLEYNVLNKKHFNMPLRLGLTRNLAENEVWVYSAGFGILAGVVFIDFACALSSQTTTIDGTNIPSSAEAAFTFGAKF